MEIITIEKYFFLLFFFWNGLGRPSPTTWAEPSPCEQCSSLFTCYMNNGGVAGTAKVAEKVDLWGRLGGAAGGGGATALLGARWCATNFFLFAVQRREPLFFLFLFFSSFARRAAAAGGDRKEAQRWRCWAEGGRPPPLPLRQPSPSFFFSLFFSLSYSFSFLFFSGSPLLFFSQHC